MPCNPMSSRNGQLVSWPTVFIFDTGGVSKGLAFAALANRIMLPRFVLLLLRSNNRAKRHTHRHRQKVCFHQCRALCKPATIASKPALPFQTLLCGFGMALRGELRRKIEGYGPQKHNKKCQQWRGPNNFYMFPFAGRLRPPVLHRLRCRWVLRLGRCFKRRFLCERNENTLKKCTHTPGQTGV